VTWRHRSRSLLRLGFRAASHEPINRRSQCLPRCYCLAFAMRRSLCFARQNALLGLLGVNLHLLERRMAKHGGLPVGGAGMCQFDAAQVPQAVR
jgi:hypothetical protein